MNPMISRLPLIALLIVSVMAPLAAQETAGPDPGAEKALIMAEMQKYRSLTAASLTAPEADENYDVTWYKLDVTITPNPNLIAGTVTIR